MIIFEMECKNYKKNGECEMRSDSPTKRRKIKTKKTKYGVKYVSKE
ncbi:hypothetical protein A3Q56_07342 [Intoshia linei]|uniref:Uncharacterized protein n=1 Tax=Intoshia linei TaxID=1819745 RepID=A0A177ASF8_9BILA|nr:hypothetical protein A3Q56_07342 [Intoshia linei]